jgi:hypothetical protein
MVAATMAGPRVVRPIVRTYVTESTSPKGARRIHARLYSPKHDLDRRGTGRDLDEALRRAKTGLHTAR